jgi:hypothetical protein
MGGLGSRRFGGGFSPCCLLFQGLVVVFDFPSALLAGRHLLVVQVGSTADQR